MLKKLARQIRQEIKEDYKFIICILLLFIIFQIPVNYYIVVGGGVSDISSRVEVEDAYQRKGTFNISYVEELKGTTLTYLLSYVIPTWERESANDYKYTESEKIEDIEFRSDLDLKTVNGTATYWAYTLANKDVKETSTKLYVTAVLEEEGIALKIKDEILKIDHRFFSTIKEYQEYLQTKEEGEIIEVEIIRNKKERTIKTKLIKREDTIMLGVGLQYVREYETNPKVKIKFKSTESGPSGGLITTLEIYNQLTKKDLTKGKTIAGTGTIEMDGTIGQIGGIEHKLLGAEKAKVKIFLVPSGQNYKDALQYKENKNLKIELIEVETIEDAIRKLEELE